MSEADHPLLCEGTRRQRGELAVSMIVHYKDDQHKLSKVPPTPAYPAADLPRKHTFGISHTAIFTPSCRYAEVFTCAHSMSFSLTSCARTDWVYTIHDV